MPIVMFVLVLLPFTALGVGAIDSTRDTKNAEVHQTVPEVNSATTNGIERE